MLTPTKMLWPFKHINPPQCSGVTTAPNMLNIVNVLNWAVCSGQEASLHLLLKTLGVWDGHSTCPYRAIRSRIELAHNDQKELLRHMVERVVIDSTGPLSWS